MGVFYWIALAGAAAFAQQDLEISESFLPNGEHPRLFLTASRLKRLRRGRERQELRWEPFRLLMAGHARMPEPGFAEALYYEITGDGEAGRQAVEWALGGEADLRQQALVFDWCQEALTPERATALATRLAAALARPPGPGVAETRDRALAAIALADRNPRLAARELERIVTGWWRKGIVPALEGGRDVLPRRDGYALLELLHAIRDNLGLDLRESAREYFRQLPILDLLAYYPATYPAPENDYRIPAGKGESDLTAASLARAADLALVAYDTNAVETQYLQGWLTHDRFQMRGAFGAPYELLWANPYQPGLSYYNAPLRLHDRLLGRLFLRSSWDDDGQWMAYFGGQLQTFAEGEPRVLPLEPGTVHWLGEIAVVAGGKAAFARLERRARRVFLAGLDPSAVYQVEFDDREMREERSDPGGILEYEFQAGFAGGIGLRRVP